MTRSLAAACALVLTVVAGAAQADVRASLSRSQVALGDAVTLSLQATGGPGGAMPDLSPLTPDFTVLSTGQSTSTSVVNGVMTQNHGWTIALEPNRTGMLTVPPITVGGEMTEVLSIEVLDPAQMPRGDLASDGLQVDMSVPDGTFYVQQEIPVTVRVTLSMPVRQADLSDPSSPDVVVTRTGPDRSSQDTVGGKPVTVIERSYLVKPQKSGAITLPPVTLRAVVDDPNAPAPFGGDSMFDQMRRQMGLPEAPFGDLMNPGREVVARSQPVNLEIKAQPGHRAEWFLPARNVELRAAWQPESPDFKVGEAVSRVVQIVALGASKEQLPDLVFGDVDGAKVYVDRVDDQSADTGDGTAAIKQYRLSVVPTRGGAVTLPELRVTWLDTASGEEKTATLAPETIEVAGGAPVATLPSSSTPSQSATTPQVSAAAVPAARADGSRMGLFALTAMAAMLVLASVLWVRHRRQTGPRADRVRANGAEEQAAKASAALRRACRRNDADAAYACLRAWLAESGRTLNHMPELSGAVRALEARLYGADRSGGWDGHALLSAFDAVQAETVRGRGTRRTGALPPLYDPGAGGGHEQAAT